MISSGNPQTLAKTTFANGSARVNRNAVLQENTEGRKAEARTLLVRFSASPSAKDHEVFLFGSRVFTFHRFKTHRLKRSMFTFETLASISTDFSPFGGPSEISLSA
jgi:hypothetical protein